MAQIRAETFHKSIERFNLYKAIDEIV